jgi:flagellar biosynthesis/type III secretory pathway chaperone
MNKPGMNTDDILLHEINQTCQQLLACLHQEFASLSQREYQTVLTLSQSKQLLVEKLDALDEQVRNSKSIQQHTRWPALRNTLQECHLQNASNGKLLARSYQLSKETLGILTGQGKTSDTTYNLTGIQQSSASTLANVTA